LVVHRLLPHPPKTPPTEGRSSGGQDDFNGYIGVGAGEVSEEESEDADGQMMAADFSAPYGGQDGSAYQYSDTYEADDDAGRFDVEQLDDLEFVLRPPAARRGSSLRRSEELSSHGSKSSRGFLSLQRESIDEDVGGVGETDT